MEKLRARQPDRACWAVNSMLTLLLTPAKISLYILYSISDNNAHLSHQTGKQHNTVFLLKIQSNFIEFQVLCEM